MGKNRIISAILSIITFITAFSFCAVNVSAIVTVSEGDFSYALNDDDTYSIYKYYGNETDLTLPASVFGEKVTSIYENAFSNSELTSVIIPENYQIIGENAFYNCRNLIEVNFPSTLVSIGSYAFYNCSSLETADLSDASSLTKISSWAFYNTAIKSVNSPISLTTIGNSAFEACGSLERVALSEKLKNISNRLFYGCASLSDIELPTALKTIGESAFENDESLTELFVYDKVTQIGANAFYPMSVSKTLTISCYENSYAEEYCYDNFLEYVLLKKIMGDVNLDGEMDILDVSLIQRYKINDYDISTARARELADVNRDGKISIRDATLIQMKLAKIDVDF